jgi:hypothetical protein
MTAFGGNAMNIGLLSTSRVYISSKTTVQIKHILQPQDKLKPNDGLNLNCIFCSHVYQHGQLTVMEDTEYKHRYI